MIYKSEQASFNLISVWSCVYVTQSDGSEKWKIFYGPTRTARSVGFLVSLPADAVISRAWLEVKLGSPLSGAAVRTVNGEKLPSSGVFEIKDITAATTAWPAYFEFQANGKIYQDTAEHSASLSFTLPTLYVEYTSDSSGGENDDPTIFPGGSLIREENGGLQLPRLLRDDLSEIRRLHPDKCSVTLNLQPLHTANMHLPPVTPPGASTYEVPVRSFVELFTPIGSAGIFRVTDMESTYGDGEGQTVYLESALCTLTDDLVLGVQAMTGTVAQVFATLLEAQTVKYWELGDCEVPNEYELIYDHTYDNILEAITKLLGMLPEQYYMQLDTLTVPFQLHIRALNSSPSCEMRLSRNLQSARITLDSRDLCTRLYPFGSGEGTDRIGLSSLTGAQYMDADTIGTWGVVARTWTEEDIFDSITLQDVAKRYLDKYKNPVLSIEAKAVDLYHATGLTWDNFVIGRRCQVALPDYRTQAGDAVTYNEAVISVAWDDVYNNPENMTVTLANRVRTAADEIADLMREATSSKLIGGTVKTEELKNNAGSITTSSPYVHRFDIEDYGNLLAARVTYICTNTATGTTTNKCSVTVDGNAVEGSYDRGAQIDIFQYLNKDASGIPTVGTHTIGVSPTISGTYRVQTTVILKKIERK